MKIYLAGPLFTAAEQQWNLDLAKALRDLGHEVFVPQQECVPSLTQEQDPNFNFPKFIFDTCTSGVLWADVVVSNLDGPDPDSGTCFEHGFAYGITKPIVAYRTDFRKNQEMLGGPSVNIMLAASANHFITVNGITPKTLAGLINAAVWPYAN